MQKRGSIRPSGKHPVRKQQPQHHKPAINSGTHRASQPQPASKPSGSLGRTALSTLGDWAGGFLGGSTGSSIGKSFGGWISDILGFGAYKVRGNTLLTDSVPQFKTTTDGILVSHREYLRDVYGSVNFTNNLGNSVAVSPFSGLINPGNPILFPWLSSIAQSFEIYEFMGLIFEFKSTSASALNSTNTALGVVVMSTNYDVLDNNFTTKQQAESYEYTVSTAPCESKIHPVECAPFKNPMNEFYVTGVSSTNTLLGDPRLFYMGNFQLMSMGMQAAANIGELWVSYEVRLKRPKLPTPLNNNLPYAHITGVFANGSSYFSGTPVLAAGSTLPVTATITAGPVLTLTFANNAGDYVVDVQYNVPAANSCTYVATWNNFAANVCCTSTSGNVDQIGYDWLPATIAASTTGHVTRLGSLVSQQIQLPQYSTTGGNNVYLDIFIYPVKQGITAGGTSDLPLGTKNCLKRLIRETIDEQFNRESTDPCHILPSLPPILTSEPSYYEVRGSNGLVNTTRFGSRV